MKLLAAAGIMIGALTLGACTEQKSSEAPPAHELTTSAIGHYCGMNVLEHTGPKGQIILASRPEPVWFSSARDAVSFTMLPEEPKDIRAVYVSDMARAPSWEEPGAMNWVDAKQASFVIGSRMKGGMGAPEAVPFSDRAVAEKFAAENGGQVVSLSEIPQDYVLGTAEATSSVEGEHETEATEHDHAVPSLHRPGQAH
jgi:copper chaperone NosL